MQGCPRSPDLGKFRNFALHLIVLILWRELFRHKEEVHRPPSLEVRSLEVTFLNSHSLSPACPATPWQRGPWWLFWTYLWLLYSLLPETLPAGSFIPFGAVTLWLGAHLILSSSGSQVALPKDCALSITWICHFWQNPNHTWQDETSMQDHTIILELQGWWPPYEQACTQSCLWREGVTFGLAWLQPYAPFRTELHELHVTELHLLYENFESQSGSWPNTIWADAMHSPFLGMYAEERNH